MRLCLPCCTTGCNSYVLVLSVGVLLYCLQRSTGIPGTTAVRRTRQRERTEMAATEGLGGCSACGHNYKECLVLNMNTQRSLHLRQYKWYSYLQPARDTSIACVTVYIWSRESCKAGDPPELTGRYGTNGQPTTTGTRYHQRGSNQQQYSPFLLCLLCLQKQKRQKFPVTGSGAREPCASSLPEHRRFVGLET